MKKSVVKKTSSKKLKIRELFAKGMSVAKIAKRVGLSESGTRWHLAN